MSLVPNERAKLTAAWLNTLASASVVVGALGPIAAAGYGVSPGGVSARGLVAGVAVWFVIGGAIHLAARQVLGRLKP